MAKVFEFIYYENQWEQGNYKCTQRGDNSGEYVSLAEYKALEDEFGRDYKQCAEYMLKCEALLKRWNEIAPLLGEIFTIYEFEDAPSLTQLIADTKEALERPAPSAA